MLSISVFVEAVKVKCIRLVNAKPKNYLLTPTIQTHKSTVLSKKMTQLPAVENINSLVASAQVSLS